MPDILPPIPFEAEKESFLSSLLEMYFELSITFGAPVSKMNFLFSPFNKTSTAIKLPAIVNVQICACAHEIQYFDSSEEFHKYQEEEGHSIKFADQSFAMGG